MMRTLEILTAIVNVVGLSMLLPGLGFLAIASFPSPVCLLFAGLDVALLLALAKSIKEVRKN